jgi:putative polyhydroxyalkanoate system protein
VAADIGSRFDLTHAWIGDNLVFRGRGVDGNIAVTDESVDIRIKLGFTLMMLQGAIRQAIENSIDEYITE